MSKYERCDDCGRNVDTEAPHDHDCPGSDDDRIGELEATIEDLESTIDDLQGELAELRGRVTSELAELRALVDRARFF